MKIKDYLTIPVVTLFAMFLLSGRTEAAGARLLSDLNPGSGGSYPSNFTTFGTFTYFTAYTFETGFELFQSDGTTVTLAANINPTADDIGLGQFEGNDSLPDWLTSLNGQLYFSAFEPRRGAELWKFDGNQAARVSDINPDANDTIKVMPRSAWPRELTVVNNVLYFSANSGTSVQDYELWSFDGTTVRRAADIHPGTGVDHSSYPNQLTAFNGSLFFMADDGTNGWELFKHSAGTTTLLNINPGGAESSSFPKYFTEFGGHLYFQANHSGSGYELWRTDGTTASLAVDTFAGTESSFPEFLTVFNGALYFRGTDSAHGTELQRYNGAAVDVAADINAAGSSFPKFLTVLGSTLVIAADDGVNGWELWKFDGTTATLITNLNANGDAFPDNLTIHNGALYFTATTPETGYEVWKFDGSKIQLAADINEGAGDSFPRALTSSNGRLYFSAATDGTSNWEPWVLEESATQNQPPVVSISAPITGATFRTSDVVTVSASASDDVAVSKVEFFANGTLIATDTESPYTASTSLAAGSYALTARATDSEGLAATTGGVNITVVESQATAPVINSIARFGGNVVISASSTQNAPLILQATTDLRSWSNVASGTPEGGRVAFTQAATERVQLFRILSE